VTDTATEETKSLVRREEVSDDGEFANLLDTGKFEHLWRVAELFAATDLVPEHFRRKPANCFVATQMAVRLGVDPFMFMQHTFVVHGRPGMSAQLAIALVNARGPFDGPIRYDLDGEGPTRRCVASAKLRASGDVVSTEIKYALAEAEGWTEDKKKRDGTPIVSKWKTMTDRMLEYRSAAWLIRLYAPEVLIGMNTVDELEDITPETAEVFDTVASLPSGRVDLTPAGSAGNVARTGPAQTVKTEEQRQTVAAVDRAVTVRYATPEEVAAQVEDARQRAAADAGGSDDEVAAAAELEAPAEDERSEDGSGWKFPPSSYDDDWSDTAPEVSVARLRELVELAGTKLDAAGLTKLGDLAVEAVVDYWMKQATHSRDSFSNDARWGGLWARATRVRAWRDYAEKASKAAK